MLYFLFVIILLNAAEGTPNKLYSILDAAPTHCFNISKFANDGGSDSVFYVNIIKPIPVWHIHNEVKAPNMAEMESINLWMWFDRKWHRSRKNPGALLYIPGRTIIFDDVKFALLHLGITNVTLNGPPSKVRAMKIITKILSKKYDSMVFRQHLDGYILSKTKECNGHCCKNGSKLSQEIVSLRGWNISQCPGHENLSWSTGPCDCLHTSFC